MERLSERRLGVTEAVAQTLAIGPVVSVGFAAYLSVKHAGAAATLTIIMAFAGAAAMGWVVTRFSRRYAGPGGVYEYIAATSPPAPAVFLGSAYFLQGLVTSVSAIVGGVVAQGFCDTHLGFDPGWIAPGLLIVAFVGVLTLLGIRLATRWVLGITAVGAVPLLIVTIAALAGAGADGLSLTPFDPGEGDVLAALPYAIVLFMGFEAAACLGEESRDPLSSIPRAIPLGIAACGIFYLVTIYATTIGIGTDVVGEKWGADPLAVVGLADEIVGKPLGALIHAAVLFDIVALAIAGMNLGSRGWLALGRDGLAPRALESVSRWGTPLAGTAVMIGANLALVGFGIALDDPIGVFEASFTARPLIVLGIYLAFCAIAAGMLRDQHAPLWHWLVLAVGITVPFLGIYGTLDPWPTGAREVGLYLTGGILVICAAWVAWLRSQRPAVLSAVRDRAPVPVPAPGA